MPYSCNDVRVKGDDLFLRRDSGEIVQFVEALNVTANGMVVHSGAT
ncbi:hypothetical protein [Paraburkholderia guartelaensis]|nr:hypothetical protein [Paraburkholderia guartelaensis]